MRSYPPGPNANTLSGPFSPVAILVSAPCSHAVRPALALAAYETEAFGSAVTLLQHRSAQRVMVCCLRVEVLRLKVDVTVAVWRSWIPSSTGR